MAPIKIPVNPVKFEQRVGEFVQLRDKIKQLNDTHKETIKPYVEALAGLNALLVQHLNTVGADNVGTKAGTVYRSTKDSASIADMEAFWGFVEKNDAWELIDKRANVTAVRDFIEENKGPPPGVNFTSVSVAGVRRK